MVDIATIIDGLLQRGIVLTLDGGNHVDAEPISGLTDAELATLRAHKADVMAYLRAIPTRRRGQEAQSLPATVEAAAVATVSATPMAGLPPKRRRGFLVSLDGVAVCGMCGERGQVPHHLSLVFWQFWTRGQVSALVQQMEPSECLSWLAHRLVRLQAADGTKRHLREQDGVWLAEVVESGR
jgi:hypothetical protein